MILTKEEATEFFSDFFCGEHHIPNELEAWGKGWAVKCFTPIATTDYDGLTKLVVMAHDRCIRAEIIPVHGLYYRIAIHKRTREGGISLGHPTLEDSIVRVREYKKYYKN